MILKDGTHWEPQDEDVIAWQHAYPKVDIFAELSAMDSWADANPSKRKTKTGAKRFVNAWLSRASQQERGVSPFAQKAQAQDGIINPKQMTNLDMLTHDFLNSPSFREHCLASYGQYLSHKGERHVA